MKCVRPRACNASRQAAVFGKAIARHTGAAIAWRLFRPSPRRSLDQLVRSSQGAHQLQARPDTLAVVVRRVSRTQVMQGNPALSWRAYGRSGLQAAKFHVTASVRSARNNHVDFGATIHDIMQAATGATIVLKHITDGMKDSMPLCLPAEGEGLHPRLPPRHHLLHHPHRPLQDWDLSLRTAIRARLQSQAGSPPKVATSRGALRAAHTAVETSSAIELRGIGQCQLISQQGCTLHTCERMEFRISVTNAMTGISRSRSRCLV